MTCSTLFSEKDALLSYQGVNLLKFGFVVQLSVN